MCYCAYLYVVLGILGAEQTLYHPSYTSPGGPDKNL